MITGALAAGAERGILSQKPNPMAVAADRVITIAVAIVPLIVPVTRIKNPVIRANINGKSVELIKA